MKRRHAAALALLVWHLTMLPSLARAQEQTSELRVAAYLLTPLVIENNGVLTGFSIDLWNAIAARMGVKTDYQVVSDISAVSEALRSNKVDLLVTPVFVTSARDAQFDFSYPILETGLQIMVRDTGGGPSHPDPFRDLLRLLLSPTMLLWLGIGLVLMLIPAHVIWLLDRHRKDGITGGEAYVPGIFRALIWAGTALVSQMQGLPSSWLGRVLALVWMFAGVVFVAFYTAQLTATLTMEQIRGSIEGPNDLPGKQVATIANSTAVDYFRARNTQVETFDRADQMFQALLDKKVDAVVAAAPILLYYAAHDGKGHVKLVGPEFNSAPVAMLFKPDSPLRRKVDSALIALRENGTYRQIYQKWFGTP
ncbi:MAG: transporter substrate-binding domain-containing protein [Candidatus Binataceae bacterium]